MRLAIRCAAFLVPIALLTLKGVPKAQITDGSIAAWGSNAKGQCAVPEPNSSFVAIAAGVYHSLGLRADGTIVAWGDNEHGQRDVPSPNADFVAIAGSGYHSLGLKSDGSVIGWGQSIYHQLDVPPPNSGFVAIAAGQIHSLGLRSDGTIAAWGDTAFGECSVPSPNTNFVAIALGCHHSLGLKSDGTIVAWGENGYGQLNVPQPNTGFVAIAAGYWNSVGLKSDGSIVAWGSIGTVPDPNIDFVAIAANENHGLGLKRGGSIVTWGGTQYAVPEPNWGFTAIAAGSFHNIGLKGVPFRPTVTDVPDDEGGEVQVSWRRHYLDLATALAPATTYDIQRFGSAWQTLATIAAVQADSYAVVVPTPDILTLGQLAPHSRYRIEARTANPAVFYESAVDSGYSIDNIPPPAPVVSLYDTENSRVLIWQNPAVADFKETCLYRGESPDFTPGDPLQCSTGIFYQEPHLIWYAYKARSFDIHGNASEWSNEVVGRYPTGVPTAPTVLRLYPNQPNPFNPMTTIRFDLPEAGSVRLSIYDVAGRLVRVLVEGERPAGSFEAVWDGRDVSGRALASGSYFARLEAGGKVEAVRLSLVR